MCLSGEIGQDMAFALDDDDAEQGRHLFSACEACLTSTLKKFIYTFPCTFLFFAQV